MRSHVLSGKPKPRLRFPWTPYLLIAPFILSFLLFFLYPAGYSLYLSFTKFNGLGMPKWVGIANFTALFQYGFFWKAVQNTLFYMVAGIIPATVLSFSIAYAIHSPCAKYPSLYKMCIYLPQTMAAVASSLVFVVIFGTKSGVLNRLLGLSVPWLEKAPYTPWAVVILITWRGIGWYMLVYLSGLATLDVSMLESARVDGANGLQVLLRIVVPMMRPIFAYTIVVGSINSLKIYTEPRVLLTQVASLPPAVQPVVGMLVNNVQSGIFGMASAIGWILFVLIFLIYQIFYVGFGFGREE